MSAASFRYAVDVLSAAPPSSRRRSRAEATQMTPTATSDVAHRPSGTNVDSEIVKPTASVATVPAKMAKNDSQPTMKPAIGW